MSEEIAPSEVEETTEETTEVNETEDDDLLPVLMPEWDTHEVEQINQVLNGDELLEGEKVAEFEEKFAQYVEADYCVTFSTKTTALYSVLLAARQILSTKNIRVPNIGDNLIYNSAIQAGYNPVLTEVNELGSLVLRDNEGGVANHFNGRKGKASLIEDCSDIPNFHTKDKLSVYNFDATSVLTTGGQGAAICCDSPEMYEALLRMKNSGKSPLQGDEIFGDNNSVWGLDFTMTEIQAAFGLAQLEKLDAKLERMNVMDNILREAFIDHKHVQFLQGRPYKYLDIMVPDAVKTQADLAKRGIMTQRLPRPLHLQNYSMNAGRIDNTFPESERLYKSGLFIPTIPSMADDDFRKILEEIKNLQW